MLSYAVDCSRFFSHVDELGKLALSAVMSWKAPAAMYFVISVFPISITSGVLPPARVASNFWRCVPHVWYCTSTVTPGWSLWNCAFAAATIGAQFAAWASVCSQTVMLFAAVRSGPETDAAAEAAIARAAVSTATAMVRPFMKVPPTLRTASSGDQDGGSAVRLAYTTRSQSRGSHIHPRLVKTNLADSGTYQRPPAPSRT